jgi:hypothetical protein
VIDLVDDCTVKVKFVDVGFTTDVNINTQIKNAAVELNELEIQSFNCILRGAVPKDGTRWTSDEGKVFHDLTRNKLLLVCYETFAINMLFSC